LEVAKIFINKQNYILQYVYENGISVCTYEVEVVVLYLLVELH